MFYVKNVPNWERVLRVIVGVAAVIIGLSVIGGTAGIVLALAAAGIVGSGLFGFCPMCAMVGRRLDKAAKQAHGPR
ncbi:DUF2892 domain-containing protein [Rugamonas sp.]|uniref:YgaP family membrane protein n=1 Tax=Rugamonas sp. TaxID=1926287 RepID=UPI0025DE7664|nr:DUF2892 domain-containing protein [Rugamonas sp.]